MNIDLKKILLMFLIDTTMGLFFATITVVFYMLGMFLTENNLPNDYLLSLIIAGVIGGFWGVGLEQMLKIPKEEISKLRTQSYTFLSTTWAMYFIVIFVIDVVLGFFMFMFHMVPIPY